jgi:hypothetical protein
VEDSIFGPVFKPFENWTQKSSRKWLFQNRTVRFLDVHCMFQETGGSIHGFSTSIYICSLLEV